MSPFHPQSIDFEQWRELAKRDPAGFEARRLELIEALIDSSSPRRQRRLRGLQWRIDLMRDHAANPLAACVSLNRMMWESFAGKGGLAQILSDGPSPRRVAIPGGKRVLPFPGTQGKQTEQ
ncbi:MAG: DUF3135 domain-containing protein [Gammaproteobacteria bacterium]|nr:DUF3135 domain-containing protein [Gammaproteobacteria bacterium]